MRNVGIKVKFAAMAIASLTLAGCASSGEGGASLSEMFLLGGTTVPPAAPPASDEVYCPRITIPDGGAVLRGVVRGRSTDGESVRSQINLGQVVRECVGRPDGSTVVKVGVEGRVLLTYTGGGRYDVPVRAVVKSGSRVIANRSVRAVATVPQGDSQGGYVAVIENILVPAASAEDFEIEVGLGGRG
jgi:hypothetical protein